MVFKGLYAMMGRNSADDLGFDSRICFKGFAIVLDGFASVFGLLGR